jgi:hypothetical protein
MNREERVLDYIFHVKVMLTQRREPFLEMSPQRAAQFRQELAVSRLVAAKSRGQLRGEEVFVLAHVVLGLLSCVQFGRVGQ